MPSFFAVRPSHSNHPSRTVSLTTCRSVTTLLLTSRPAFAPPIHHARWGLLCARIGAQFSMSLLPASRIPSVFTGSATATPRTLGASSSLAVLAASPLSSDAAPIHLPVVRYRCSSRASWPMPPRRSRMSSGCLSRSFMHASSDSTATLGFNFEMQHWLVANEALFGCFVSMSFSGWVV